MALIIGIWVGNATGRQAEPPASGTATASQPVAPESCLTALDLVAGGDASSPEFKSAASDCRSKAPGGTVQVGQPAKDGAFTFVVNDVRCGETVVGRGDVFSAEAQGMFCLVEVTVTNHGDEAQELVGSAQKLIDHQGRIHDHSNEAWLAMEETLLHEQVNPGNTVKGTLVFDVPKDTRVAALELHDSSLSGGVRVAVP